MVGHVLVGRYEIQRLLGEGGMGKVYLARQLDLERQVVVKVMHDHIAADPTFCERFQRETLLMARFQHPYGVSLYDASLANPDGGPFIVMEHIRGITLDVLLQRNGRLSPSRVGRILGQFCEVLQAAHAAGIIHRDLKPANLMVVDPDTPYELIKVMDFGLAKLLDPDPNQMAISNSEFAVGTPGYMCPEQARGEEMDHRGDLYSVGVILFELLAGRLPFTGDATMDILISHATEPPPSFAEVGADSWISHQLELVVRKCLEKDPADRPANARELATLFDKALHYEIDHPREPALPPDEPLVDESVSQTVAAGNGIQPLTAASATTPSGTETLHDPFTVRRVIKAWMPEQIAAYKLRGFVSDQGGDLLESVPGRILVRFGGKHSSYTLPRDRSFAWFGLARKASYVDMELQLEKPNEDKSNELHITVELRPSIKNLDQAESWRTYCMQIYCDLRAYLMGASEATV